MPLPQRPAPSQREQPGERDLQPLAVTTLVAVLSVTLVLMAARTGWFGPDVGRGDGFCEAARSGWLKQPANALSNLGFVLAGLRIAWLARLPDGRLPIGRSPDGSAAPGGQRRADLVTPYAVVVVLLGPGSMAMHATQTAVGGHLDLTSMFLISSFAASSALTRTLERGLAFFAVVFAALLAGAELVEAVPGSVPVLMSWGNVAFAALLLVALVLERRLHLVSGLGDVRWIGRSVAALGVAFVVWNLSKDDAPLCDPHSLLQGHAVWHVLCATSAFWLYRYWVSASRR